MRQNLNPKLEQIDKFLCFYGKVSREMLVEALDISTATASRALREYNESYQTNITLISGQNGGYRAADAYTPLCDHDPEAALELFCNGTVTTAIKIPTFGPQYSGVRKPKLRLGVVAPISRAIVASQAAGIEYTSGSSGKAERIVHPTHVFFGGGAWYFRAFDEKSGEHRTFRFSRVAASWPAPEKSLQILDPQWEERVNLTISPHDKHPFPEALALDIGVEKGCAQNIVCNAVVAGFLLNDLRVDCSKGGSLNPSEYPFRLINLKELEGVESMKIAPGYC